MKHSIIITGYNCEEYVEDCIDSVLKQTYDNFEILVYNDGSADNTKKFLEKYERDLKYDDDVFNDYEVYSQKLTNFYGWDCYNNNYEIDVRGNVVQFCMNEDGGINILRDLDFFKRITKTVAITCPHKQCNCDGLLKQLKIKK